MRESPRIRRLRNDRKSMEKLRSESSIIDFDVSGEPADKYLVRFHGRGLWRSEGQKSVLLRELHEVRISLGASYPRMMPELNWLTPIFHPNISASGVVCLGGYGTYWVPSLSLDELCEMLWEMIRYRNFDVDSPYNRDAALWAKTQNAYRLPVDSRPIRDRLTPPSRDDRWPAHEPPVRVPMVAAAGSPIGEGDVLIIDDLDDEVINAEVIDPDVIDPTVSDPTVSDPEDLSSRVANSRDQDILFLD